ncbi:MAG: DUF4910 domain-containing protein [Candidatus Bathyarchaeia archaeon]
MDELLDKVWRELSGFSAKDYVSAISRYHRIQASPGFDEAALHVMDELKRMGLRPELYRFDSDGETEYFTFISPIGWRVGGGELWIEEPRRELLGTYRETPTLIVAHSKGTPQEGLRAELVDVGLGDKPEHYEGVGVEGKFVLASGGARWVHLEAVEKRGALGLVLYQTNRLDAPGDPPYQGIWPTAANRDKVGIAFSISMRQAERVYRYLREGRRVVVRGRVDAEFCEGKLGVVTTLIEGSGSEEVLLIGHLCHPHPSANDNASGSGLLIELARTIKALIDKHEIPKPERSIRFMWVPEMYGTVAYLSEHQDAAKKMVAGFNLDMVGENQATCGSVLTLLRTPDSLPSYLPDLVELILDTVASKGLKAFSDTTALPAMRYKVTPYSGGSDHYVFDDPTIGSPCVAFIHWPDRFYHTSGDTIDRVDPDELKRVGVTVAVAALIVASAGSDEALMIANETTLKAVGRIKAATQRALRQALKKKGEGKTEEAERALGIGMVTIEHAAKREIEAIRSVKRIYRGSDLDDLLESLIEEVREAERVEKSKLNSLAERMGLKIEAPKMSGEMASKVPIRGFAAPLDQTNFRLRLGDAEYMWYREKTKRNRIFRAKMIETINLMDGKRTVEDIYRAVTAEYGEIKIGDLTKFLRDLEKVGLIDLKSVD